MVLDEMQTFYGCSEEYLMEVPIPRFWDKYRNMMILRTEQRLQNINTLRIGLSSKADSEIEKMQRMVEQLGKPQRVDSLVDLKKKQKEADRRIREKHEKDW